MHISGALFLRRQSLGFVVRQLLEEELPYDAFLKRLLEARLIAPCYLTVVGTESAVVVTRGKIVTEDCRCVVGWWAGCGWVSDSARWQGCREAGSSGGDAQQEK